MTINQTTESIVSFAQKEAEKQSLPIKIIKIEDQEDQSLLVYFSSDERIDFRDLVNSLRQKYKQKITMHQLGPRDKSQSIGDLGPCGRPLCCRSFLKDFTSITTKMAREQKQSQNLSSCSGMCGKLMCCLAFETETKNTDNTVMPKPCNPDSCPRAMNTTIPTPKLEESQQPIIKDNTNPVIPSTPEPHRKIVRELGNLHLRFKKKRA